MLKRIFLLAFFLLFIVVLVTAVQVAMLRFYNPKSTAWMDMRVRQAREKQKDFHVFHSWIPLKEIPRTMQKAVVAAEDDQFYQHHGFDWDAIKKAQEKNEKSGKVKRGGSTVTQQLAKNLYLSPSRSYWRKIREAMITVLMELFLTKDRILELYLNSIEFGPGIFGVEEAARYHFGISARQLSLEQSCRLAAIIPSPLKWRVAGNYVSNRALNIARIVNGTPYVQPEDQP